jgi:hypothetical protein
VAAHWAEALVLVLLSTTTSTTTVRPGPGHMRAYEIGEQGCCRVVVVVAARTWLSGGKVVLWMQLDMSNHAWQDSCTMHAQCYCRVTQLLV